MGGGERNIYSKAVQAKDGRLLNAINNYMETREGGN
jgi:hypothetical protein